jgi:hypothetical protein
MTEKTVRALPALLVAFAAIQLVTGVFLWIFPGTFYEEIGPYGVRNDHYMGDLASFYLALGAATLVAVKRQSWRVPVIALALVQNVLHAINHLIDWGETDPESLSIGAAVTLVVTSGLVAWVLVVAAREPEGTSG